MSRSLLLGSVIYALLLADIASVRGEFILLAIPLALALGSPGIALANSLVFTSIALVLFFLLNRRFPGLLQLGHTPLRVLLACLAGGGVAALILLGSTLVSHSLPSILFAIAAMGVGAIVATPFIMPEVKILIKL